MNALQRLPDYTPAIADRVPLVEAEPGQFELAPNYVGSLQERVEIAFSGGALPRHDGPSDRARLSFLILAGIAAWVSVAALGTLIYVGATHLLT
jgi:hypothetical protein